MKAVDRLAAGIAAAMAVALAAPAAQAQTQTQTQASGADYYGDARPDAPALALRGALPVGVRTQVVEHANQLDILRVDAAHPDPRGARRLTLEIWYPARLAPGQVEHVVYTDVLGSGPNDPARPNTPFQFAGRAARDAAPAQPPAQPPAPDARADALPPDSAAALSRPAPSGRYPLVIVSHGYPGSRLQMSYLTENLASKGYVVVAIDHAESTRADKAGFASTLLNRRLDDLFVLDTVAAWARPGSGHFLAGLVDVERSALVGYSMGGYGALNTVGAGISAAAVAFGPAAKLAVNAQGDPAYEAARADGGRARIRAVVAFAPWGGAHKVWDAAGLAGVRTPILFVAGDQDDVAGYRDGVLPLFENTVHAERWLLTYQGARHNTAPNPPPPAAAAAGMADYMAYAEPVWDSRRINNINQHIVTAFLGIQLKGQPLQDYLALPPLAADGTIAPDPGLWKGFEKRTALGLGWRHLPAQ